VRIHFFGTRGSLPTPLNAEDVHAKIRAALLLGRSHHFPDENAVDAFIERELPFDVKGTFGGNSSCVQIDGGSSEYVVCDAGSGLRVFGNAALARHGPDVPQTYNLCMSHFHWDHIMGFPMFAPAYIPGNTIRIYSAHADARAAFERQHAPPSFPVAYAALSATIEYVTLTPGVATTIAGMSVTVSKQKHGGDSFGYRFEQDGKAVVYATDSEHSFTKREDEAPVVGLFRNADLVIFDSMYSLGEAISMKADWGHSSNVAGVELAQRAGVKHLVLFHHEPRFDDAMIERIVDDARRYQELSGGGELEISAAYDGLELSV
jgi:phosphoribosyl 1,2-cyclic phosphodiesterase